MEALMLHAEAHFSPEACQRLKLTTTHSCKGQTYRTTIIAQGQFFPLERNMTDGGIGLVQEPKVQYVSLTRATQRLVFLVEGSTNSGTDKDTNLETLYFEL